MWKKKKEIPYREDWEDRKFPVEPSPIDSRDYIYSDHGHNCLPNQVDLRPILPKPRDLGSRGCSLAFAASSLKEYHERINLDFDGYMSPESVNFYLKNQEKNQGKNQEKNPKPQNCREIMKILHRRGIAPENLFPYQYRSEPTEIPEAAKIIMSNYRIRQYAQIKTIAAAKEAIYKYGPLLMAIPIYKNSPILWKPKTKKANRSQQSIGGHAVAIVGYNQEGFIVRNSWSESWNGDGHVIYPYSDWGSHWEIWMCIDDVSDPISTIPINQNSTSIKQKSLWQKIKQLINQIGN